MIVAEQALSPFSLQWQQSDFFPEPRSGYSGDVLNGKMVIAGGTYWNGTAVHWTKKRYSTSTHAYYRQPSDGKNFRTCPPRSVTPPPPRSGTDYS